MSTRSFCDSVLRAPRRGRRAVSISLRSGVLAIAAIVVGAACSASSGPGPGSDGSADAFVTEDAASTPDGTPADAASGDGGDGSSDGSAGCASSIAAFCETDGGCVGTCPCFADWTTAQKNARSYCTGLQRVYLYPQCDGFNLIVVGYVDTSTFFYYDPSSLALVRVEGHGNAANRCIAGTPGTIVPLTDCFDGAVPPTSLCEAEAGGD